MPTYEVIESKVYRNVLTGATASPYGAVPWTRPEEEADWLLVTGSYTVRNRRTGTVGIGRRPWTTREQAQAWVDAEEARLLTLRERT